MIRVMFVCHGNICRSPMAEFCCEPCSKVVYFDLQSIPPRTSNEELGNPRNPKRCGFCARTGFAVGMHRAVNSHAATSQI